MAASCLLSSQSVGSVMKANVAQWAAFYQEGTLKAVISINLLKISMGQILIYSKPAVENDTFLVRSAFCGFSERCLTKPDEHNYMSSI